MTAKKFIFPINRQSADNCRIVRLWLSANR